MGGPQVLQRVRPQRVSQGRDDKLGCQALRRGESRQIRTLIQIPPRRRRRWRTEARLHLCRRRVAVMRWLLDTPAVSGIFNVGTGKARSFRDLITAMFGALGREADIEYVDMPAAIRHQYQYFTQAKVENLRRAGYNAGFTPLEEGVNRYVTLFLNQSDRYR